MGIYRVELEDDVIKFAMTDGKIVDVPAQRALHASELLEACVRMVNGWGNGNDEEAAIEHMRAVVAKAEGPVMVMSNSKHTPGPYEHIAPFRIRDLTENGIEVVDRNGVVAGYAVNLRQAREFATSRELLDLLRELLKAGNANTRAAKELAKERLAAGFFADVRAAIAKAEGRE